MTDQNHNDWNLIEDYLLEKLSAEQKKDFELKVLEDERLRREVEVLRQSVVSIKDYGVRQHISEIHQQESKNKSIIFWATGIAASLVVIIIAWWLLLPPVDNKQLFNDYFQPYPDAISIRSTERDSWTAGLKEYTSGEYENAIKTFTQSAIPEENKSDVSFYSALSHLALNNTSESEELLLSLLNGNTDYTPQVRWYLGLTYLLQDQKDKMLNILQEIKEGEFKYREAQELTERVE